MAAKRKRSEPEAPNRKPATTPEAREQQLVSLAYDVAEEQMRNGTASSQVITSFIKLGTTREKLEQERLEHENELTKAKIENMAAASRIEALYEDAIRAVRSYQGETPPESDDDED